ncbi:MAG: hypothetical protein V2I38_07575 [Alcanivoracaceae bacterium]|jgi:hypothetical protein|nr:hypothetical protein [Alcanivoracaceae bacterium]
MNVLMIQLLFPLLLLAGLLRFPALRVQVLLEFKVFLLEQVIRKSGICLGVGKR